MNTVYIRTFISLLFSIISFYVNAQFQDLAGQWVSNDPIVLNDHQIKAFMLNGDDETVTNDRWKQEGLMCSRMDTEERWELPSAFHYYISGDKIGIQISYSAVGFDENLNIEFEYELLDNNTVRIISGKHTSIYTRKSVKMGSRI